MWHWQAYYQFGPWICTYTKYVTLTHNTTDVAEFYKVDTHNHGVVWLKRVTRQQKPVVVLPNRLSITTGLWTLHIHTLQMTLSFQFPSIQFVLLLFLLLSPWIFLYSPSIFPYPLQPIGSYYPCPCCASLLLLHVPVYCLCPTQSTVQSWFFLGAGE